MYLTVLPNFHCPLLDWFAFTFTFTFTCPLLFKNLESLNFSKVHEFPKLEKSKCPTHIFTVPAAGDFFWGEENGNELNL